MDVLGLAYIEEAGFAEMATVELNLGLTQLYKKLEVELHLLTELFYVQQRMRKKVFGFYMTNTTLSSVLVNRYSRSCVCDMCKCYTFPHSW